jgi:hypothetical protein
MDGINITPLIDILLVLVAARVPSLRGGSACARG